MRLVELVLVTDGIQGEEEFLFDNLWHICFEIFQLSCPHLGVCFLNLAGYNFEMHIM